MVKYIAVFFNIALTSMYLFPFMFNGLEGFNTKIMVALVGLVICGYEVLKRRNCHIGRSLFLPTIYASVVSLCGFASVTINETPDYVYATYVISMLVWISGAYAVCFFIKQAHGQVDIRLLCNYLTVVCVSQCVLALWIDYNPSVKQFVDSVVEQGQDFLNRSTVQRLYGIGANLDVAGSRFSAVLVLLAVVIAKGVREGTRNIPMALYIVSFILISIVGNMIARTTLVGLVLAFGYWIYDSGIWKLQLNKGYDVFFSWMALALPIAVLTFGFMYNTDSMMRKYIRFGFEGFFSLYERGTWDVASNDRLASMYVFPEGIKTWLIGDGYFSSPQNIDPYFTGKIRGGYYMGTDVGYLRFLFYFGMTGLIAFIAFFIKACSLCINRFVEYKQLFLMLLALNFMIWFKVSTDIFLVFALFLMLPDDSNSDEMSLQLS